MPFNYLREYIAFNVGNECPRNYHLWAALVSLASAVHKRVHIHWGYFNVYPNLFACLVGKQGSRKSTAKDIAADLFTEALPTYPIGASVQSREDIIKYMCSDECLYGFKNEQDALVEVRPIVFFINELKNFLSVDPGKMIAFLTDIYDSKRFKSGTIKRGLEDLHNPCVNILACETPRWIVDNLKANVISGGFARRMIYIYEIERGPRISFPQRPEEATSMWSKMKDHLKKVSETSGLFSWSSDAIPYWDKWYQGLKLPDDEIMAGYYESKHIQVLKVAMLLALAEDDIRLVVTVPLLEQAIAMLDILELNMPKLSVAAGRNELAVPMQTVLELLTKNDGWLPEKVLKRLIEKDLNPMEQISVIRHLTETEQVFVRDVKDSKGVIRKMIMTREKLEQVTKKTI